MCGHLEVIPKMCSRRVWSTISPQVLSIPFQTKNKSRFVHLKDGCRAGSVSVMAINLETSIQESRDGNAGK